MGRLTQERPGEWLLLKQPRACPLKKLHRSMALSFGVLLPASGSDPPLTLSPVPVPVAMWSSWSCSCRQQRSTSWWDTGSPTRSSLTSWLLCPVCPSVRARGRWSLWWTQGHLVRLQRSASCRTRVPLHEGQWVVILKVRGASWRTQGHLVRLHQPPAAGPVCLSGKAGGWWSLRSTAPRAGRMCPCSTRR